MVRSVAGFTIPTLITKPSARANRVSEWSRWLAGVRPLPSEHVGTTL
jgi:hypothetical protein